MLNTRILVALVVVGLAFVRLVACSDERATELSPPARSIDLKPPEIDALIMSFKDYREQVRKAPGLYFLHMRCTSQHLFYAGFQHSTDPNNPDFARLEAFWRRFSRETEQWPRVVLVEGRLRHVARDSASAVRSAGGEGGLITFLAHDAGIDAIQTPEPPASLLASTLSHHYSREEICYAYLARGVLLWHRQPASTRPKLESYLAGLPAVVDGCDVSLAGIRRAHAGLFDTPIDLNDPAFFARVTDPTREDQPVSRVLALDTRLRDAHIVRRITELVGAGKSIFAVLGASHAIMQEQALRRSFCARCAPAGECRVEVER